MKPIFHVLGFFVVISMASVALATTISVNCNEGETLADALAAASEGDTIQVSGLCEESVEITRDGITLEGSGNATIMGGRGEALTVVGARRVRLQGVTLRDSLIGLTMTENASVAVAETTVQGNVLAGIMVSGGSALMIQDAAILETTLIGLSVERNSEVAVSGSFGVRNSGIFGMNLAASSSITFRQANVEVANNTLGIQVSIGSSAFLTDADTTVNTSNNLTTGFTVNSGSTLFLFESTIISDHNQLNHGLSVSSNSSVDMDRDASITVRQNGIDGIRLENSHLNMFTMADLEGPTLTATGNARHGVSAFLGATIDLTFDSRILSTDNGDAGLLADNGSALRIINSQLTTNGRDVVLSFGSRAEFTANTIGSIACDATVLIRGDTGITCLTPE